MKKQITIICEGGNQFGIRVEEMSVSKIVKQIIADLVNPTKEFISLIDYVSNENAVPIYIRANEGYVKAIVVADISNIQVPNQRVFVPGGKSN